MDACIEVKVETWRGFAIGRVRIRNAARSNALSTPLIVGITEAFGGLCKHEGLRAAVLASDGDKSFIGGADLIELGALCADSGRLFITRLHQACEAIRSLPVPVVARIQGHCLGAGLELAASCDLRAAAEQATFGMPEVHVGLPSVIEAALLPPMIGTGRAREMLLTGRRYSASEALSIGLVEKVVPSASLDQAIDDWLSDICRASPAAVRSQKVLLNLWQQVPLEQGILAGIDALSNAYKTGEPQAAIAGFFKERRRQPSPS